MAYVFLLNAQTLQNLMCRQHYKALHNFLHISIHVSQSIQNICKYKLSFTDVLQSVSVTNKNCLELPQISVKIWLLIFWTSRLSKMGTNILEDLVPMYQTTKRHNLQDYSINLHHYEHLKYEYLIQM